MSFTNESYTENDLRERKERFKERAFQIFVGEKTWVFWVGLIILALASVALFTIVWFNAVNAIYYKPAVEYQVPFIVGTVVFMFIGFYMMTSGVRKKT